MHQGFRFRERAKSCIIIFSLRHYNINDMFLHSTRALRHDIPATRQVFVNLFSPSTASTSLPHTQDFNIAFCIWCPFLAPDPAFLRRNVSLSPLCNNESYQYSSNNMIVVISCRHSDVLSAYCLAVDTLVYNKYNETLFVQKCACPNTTR